MICLQKRKQKNIFDAEKETKNKNQDESKSGEGDSDEEAGDGNGDGNDEVRDGNDEVRDGNGDGNEQEENGNRDGNEQEENGNRDGNGNEKEVSQSQEFARARIVVDDDTIREHIFRFKNKELSEPMNAWDVSRVTRMDNLFSDYIDFNEDISDWETGNVTTMRGMFASCKAFQGDLSKWDVGRVTNMTSMFDGCSTFDGNLTNWNVSNVLVTRNMFRGCKNFNSDISNWKVEKNMDTSGMFEDCFKFNQRLKWSLLEVRFVETMFKNCSSLNQKLELHVPLMRRGKEMFYNCTLFNQDIRIDCRSALDISYACCNCQHLTFPIFVNATKAMCRAAYYNTAIPYLPVLPNHIGILINTHGAITNKMCGVREDDRENACLFTLDADITLAKMTSAECGYVYIDFCEILGTRNTLSDDERIRRRCNYNPIVRHYYSILNDANFWSSGDVIQKEQMESLVNEKKNFREEYKKNTRKHKLVDDEDPSDHFHFEYFVFEKGDKIIQKEFVQETNHATVWINTIDISYWDKSKNKMQHFDLGRQIRCKNEFPIVSFGTEILEIQLSELIDLIKLHAPNVNTIFMMDNTCNVYEKPEYKEIVESRERDVEELLQKYPNIMRSKIKGYGGRRKTRKRRLSRSSRKRKCRKNQTAFRSRKMKTRKQGR